MCLKMFGDDLTYIVLEKKEKLDGRCHKKSCKLTLDEYEKIVLDLKKENNQITFLNKDIKFSFLDVFSTIFNAFSRYLFLSFESFNS